VSPLAIQYRNFQGEEKTFTADSETLRRKRNHVIARVAPTGRSISLSRDRIQNLEEVEQAVAKITESQPPGPTARERQVLGYHKKHKSTSPLYEEIRAKYPDW
jgi:hypoxanthine phosphoribosyltransferase